MQHLLQNILEGCEWYYVIEDNKKIYICHTGNCMQQHRE